MQRKFFEATDQSPRLVAVINSKEYLTDVLTRLPGMLAKDASTLPPRQLAQSPQREARAYGSLTYSAYMAANKLRPTSAPCKTPLKGRNRME